MTCGLPLAWIGNLLHSWCEKDSRLWTQTCSMKAPQAAGIIHSDFEKGYSCSNHVIYKDLVKYGSEGRIKDWTHLREEGKIYRVKDGDIRIPSFCLKINKWCQLGWKKKINPFGF